MRVEQLDILTKHHLRLVLKTGLAIIIPTLILSVTAHTEEEPASEFTMGVYLLLMFAISVVVALAIFLIKRFESVPGTLPIRKLTIAGIITVLINAITFAYLYREVLF